MFNLQKFKYIVNYDQTKKSIVLINSLLKMGKSNI